MLDNLKILFTAKGTSGPTIINIVKSRRAIARAILKSKQTENVVGIYCPALGEGMLLVGIEDVLTDHREEVIILKKYDLNGILLERTHISISEIRSLCAFDSKYENPLFRKEPALV